MLTAARVLTVAQATAKTVRSCTLRTADTPPSPARADAQKQKVGTWLSLVERTLGVGEVASSNLVVPTIYFQPVSVHKRSNKLRPRSKKVQSPFRTLCR